MLLMMFQRASASDETFLRYTVKRTMSSLFLCVSTTVQTTSNNIQAMVESRIEKRTKGVFVPAGGKRLLCFLDDLNMPAHDLFGSQPPLELLRLWIDYGFWYDRQKQTLKFVKVREGMQMWVGVRSVFK